MPRFIFGLTIFFLAVASSVSEAAFPFFQNTKKVEASEDQEYYLKDSDGLWFIMAKTYTGDNAREEANKLVHELRKKYKMAAYIYKLDPDKTDLEELGRQSKMSRRYRYQTERSSEYAVLVGSFPSNEDLALQKTLLNVKRSRPACLNKDPVSAALTEKFAELARKNKEFAGYGPLGGAIAVPNPMIPKEYYSQKGVVDQFVEKINSDSPYNLLNNPKMYTLRVATFSGDSAFQKLTESDKNLKSRLQMAGIKADALCKALRKKGVEAWEFHDRDSSFVTIGSFDTYGQIRPDGRTEINAEINQLIEKYRGQMTKTSSGAYRAYTVTVNVPDPGKGFGKKTRLEIPFDLQPVIIVVPQRPENMKKTLQAQQKLKAEQRLYEMQRVGESLAAGSEEHARHYAMVQESRRKDREQNGEPVVGVNTQTPIGPNPAGVIPAANQVATMPQQNGQMLQAFAPGAAQSNRPNPIQPNIPPYANQSIPPYSGHVEQKQLPGFPAVNTTPPAGLQNGNRQATVRPGTAFGTRGDVAPQPGHPGTRVAREYSPPTY